MVKHKLISFFCLFSLVIGNILISAETPPPTQCTVNVPFENLDREVGDALAAFKVPGAAVGIIQNGRVIFAKGYGVRDLEKNLPVDAETVFGIGSLSKAFTACTLGVLVDEGKIKWEDPVTKYIPEFRLQDPEATREMTIRDLLTHQSGLPRHDALWYTGEYSRADLLARLQYLEPTAGFREKFQYNNLMYMVAGIVTERVTGKPWEEVVKEKILDPAGMTKTNFCPFDEKNNYSLPYHEKNGKLEIAPILDLKKIAPAGGINSNMTDMMTWALVQLDEGELNGKQIVSKETIHALQSPQVILTEGPEKRSGFDAYGLGFFVGPFGGKKQVAHGGKIDGFICYMRLLPEEKTGVVVLTNKDESPALAEGLTGSILEQMVMHKNRNWIANSQAKEAEIKRNFQVDFPNQGGNFQRDPNAYVGVFEHPAYGIVRVENANNTLVLSYQKMKAMLRPFGRDHFVEAQPYVLDPPAQCMFSANQYGQVSEIHLPLEPALGKITFKRIA